jgi:hypothetical protein
MNTGDWITLAAVIVALVLGVWANIQTYCIRKETAKKEDHERKVRLLGEILEWLNEVKTYRLINLPGEIFTQGNKNKAASFDLHTAIINCARILVKSETIESLITTNFKDELLNEFNIVIRNLIAVFFLAKGSNEGLHGTYLEVVAQVEQRLTNNKNRDSLIHEYDNNVSVNSNIMSEKIYKLISHP